MSRLPPGVRPDPPGPGQESVWDYPRPPALEPSRAHLTVELGGVVLADTRRSLRVLETSHPPVHYVPLDDIAAGALRPSPRTSWCEYKGAAAYYDVVVGDREEPAAAWHYPRPDPGYQALAGHVAFYPGRMDRCTLDGEVVRAQAGDFYGGWLTSRVTGPFKGAPGTRGW